MNTQAKGSETGAYSGRMPIDALGYHHSCMDETAAIVNDRWVCSCPGGPHFNTREAMQRFRAEQGRPVRSLPSSHSGVKP